MTALFRDGIPALLDARFPLPLGEPFTTAQAVAAGVTRRQLTELHRVGLIRRMLRGVHVSAEAVDSLQLRAHALRLVVPPSSIVVDRTAAWVHMVSIGAPGDHLRVPPISVIRLPGNSRLRNDLTVSGQRLLARDDVMEVDGLLVTTPLRTCMDLGRLLRRGEAMYALDEMIRNGGVDQDLLIASVELLAGERGVRQLRELAPLADPRSESFGESVMRLRWRDCGNLPPITPQVSIRDASGREVYRLDLGNEELKYAAEYDGEEHHSSEEDRARDRKKRTALAEDGWTISVLTKVNVFGPQANCCQIFHADVARARRRTGEFKPPHRDH